MLPHLGGLETVVGAETQGLLARGWRVAILSSAGTVGPGVRDEDGVRTVRVCAWNGLEERFGVPFPLFSPRLLTRMLGEVRRADVVHVHDVLYVSSWVAALCCLALRTPYVVHRHVGFVHHSSLLVRVVQGVVLATFGRIVLGGARVVLPIDEHVARGMPAEKTRVLGNGVDTGRFRPGPPTSRERRPRVLFVGRFVPKKGFGLVAAAADDAYEIAFAGGDRPPGLDDPRLTFLGAVPAAAMPEVYAGADVMVVASVGECPLTVVEAMASGLPVVLREDPALHSPWTSGPGVRFVEMPGSALRDVLRELAADPDLRARLGAGARDHVAASYSWDVHVQRLDEIYRGVTPGSPRR